MATGKRKAILIETLVCCKSQVVDSVGDVYCFNRDHPDYAGCGEMNDNLPQGALVVIEKVSRKFWQLVRQEEQECQ